MDVRERSQHVNLKALVHALLLSGMFAALIELYVYASRLEAIPDVSKVGWNRPYTNGRDDFSSGTCQRE
jgi:hypothetical protein